ncbi:MAG TPA: bifunctional DNA primase/polymerase [Kofleriaceae bacterium]|jgi:hypothetical protein|nr:bifunctional DNA primase/polymerase [Kofleriaceae bacterium]
MATDLNSLTDDEVRRLFAAHLRRLGEECIRLARLSPAERVRDESLIRIVQPRTRRVSLMPAAEQELLDGALALAARGYRVFPVGAATFDEQDRSNGKTPLLKGWPGRATTGEATIRMWWEKEFVGANIGIATGAASNLTVVDLDHRPGEQKDGPGQIAALEAKHGALELGPIVRRGTSAHLYFRYVPGLRSRSITELPGVDVKNDGGYVVAPPSFHRTGGRYVWADDSSERALPTMPPWLIVALTPESKSNKGRAQAVVLPSGHSSRPSGVRNVPVERQDAMRALIDAIRARLTVDEVLEHYGLDATPTCCPLHGGDNPTAFKMYPDDPSRWHCFTRCEEGERDGDVIDLIQRLEDCSFDKALTIAVGIIEPEENASVVEGSCMSQESDSQRSESRGDR